MATSILQRPHAHELLKLFFPISAARRMIGIWAEDYIPRQGRILYHGKAAFLVRLRDAGPLRRTSTAPAITLRQQAPRAGRSLTSRRVPTAVVPNRLRMEVQWRVTRVLLSYRERKI